MKNLKWIRNSGFPSVLKVVVAHHLSFPLLFLISKCKLLSAGLKEMHTQSSINFAGFYSHLLELEEFGHLFQAEESI